MSFVDYAAREINFKFVYYGPGLVGKTTNLQWVYNKTRPEQKTQMVSLATETERTLLFSLRPVTLAPIRGFGVRLHLYTVPGPVFYDNSRVLILKGADGVAFVADSQRERLDANVESFENLETNLAVHGYDLASVPLVVQYNKRDLPSAMPTAELDAALGVGERPRIEAIAMQGVGVFDTLKALAKLVVQRAREAAGE
jgi:hypothetical protein